MREANSIPTRASKRTLHPIRRFAKQPEVFPACHESKEFAVSLPVFLDMVSNTAYHGGLTASELRRRLVLEMQSNKPINVCPSTEGGKNWQAMSYHQPTGLLVVPLSQSCME